MERDEWRDKKRGGEGRRLERVARRRWEWDEGKREERVVRGREERWRSEKEMEIQEK